MRSAGGRQSGELSVQSLSRFDSSFSMQRRKMNMDRTCVYGLKTIIKKFGIPENSGKLFHICPRYRIDDKEYKIFEVANGGTEAEFEVESDYKN
ncbi:hypothetical protein AHAS_Ahas16G0120400 [Arachis hypogaea]